MKIFLLALILKLEIRNSYEIFTFFGSFIHQFLHLRKYQIRMYK